MKIEFLKLRWKGSWELNFRVKWLLFNSFQMFEWHIKTSGHWTFCVCRKLWARTISSVLFSTIRIEWCGEVGFVFVSGSTCLGLGTYCTRVVFIWWCVLAMKNIFVTRGIDWNLRTDVGKTKIKTGFDYDFWRFLVVVEALNIVFDVWQSFMKTGQGMNRAKNRSSIIDLIRR